MKKDESAYITVGKIGSTYGVQGWLKIQSYTEFGASLLSYKPWYLSKGESNWEEVAIEQGRIHGNGIIAKFTGIDNPEDGRLLTGRMIAIHRSQLPRLKKDEFYWSDLEGLTVINKNGEILGKVIYLMATGGSNDVIVVKGDKEHALPYLPHVILSIDLVAKEMHVDWEPL